MTGNFSTMPRGNYLEREGALPQPSITGQATHAQRLVIALRPVQHLSVQLRYVYSTGLVLICLLVRLALEGIYPYPFLFFFPGIILSSIFFNRGTGIYATVLSAVLAYYFFVEPAYTMSIKDAGAFIAITGLSIVGIFTAMTIECLRKSLDQQAMAFAQLQEATGKYKAIFDTAIEAIITIDSEGKIRTANPATEKIFGYKTDELVGRNGLELLSPQQAHELRNHLSSYLKTGKKQIIGRGQVVEGKKKDGQLFRLHLSVAEWQDTKGEKFFTGIMRDISMELAEKARVQHYMEELEDSNNRLDDFVYIVSHDLKEPVRGIFNFAGFLLDDYSDKLDEEGKNQLRTLKTMAERMQEMIGDLLHYSVLSRDTGAFEWVNIGETVQSVIELLQIQLKAKNVDITVHKDLPNIYCSKAQIAEVIRNLITNAMKYNEKKPIKIEIGCVTDHLRRPGKPVFYVKDNGIGIPEEHREDIFKMFKRLHGREKYGGGTGSGLAIVKRVIDQHNGDIWVESRKDQGSTFFFYVDCARGTTWRARQDSNLQPTA